MRFASVLVSLVALVSACGDTSFSGDTADAGASDASSDAAATDAASDASSEAGSHTGVAVRDFNSSTGDLSTGDSPLAVKVPGGAQPSDVVIAVIALYAVSGNDTTTIVPPLDWQPTGSFFNDVHGGNASIQWHAFAFATKVSVTNETAVFTVHGFLGAPNPTHFYSALIAYSGTSVAAVDFKGISDTPDEYPYVSFGSVIVPTNGSHVLTGILAQDALPNPLLGLPPGANEVGSGFMSGYGRFTDQPVPTATTLPAYTIPTRAADASVTYWSTTFQFVVAPAS